MPQYIDFQPTIDQPFQFPAVFDGGQYQVVLTWGLFGQRYYVNCYAADGTLVFSKALVGSQTWRQAILTTQQDNYLAAIDDPSYLGPGTVIISANAAPGTLVRYIFGASIAMNAPATATGNDASAAFSNDINLLGGYFTTSTLVYRNETAQFEIGTYPPTAVVPAQQLASPTFVPAVPPPVAILPVTSPFPPSNPPVRVPNPFVLNRSNLDSPDVLVP